MDVCCCWVSGWVDGWMEQVEATCFASAGRHGSIFGQSGLPKIRQAPPQKISCLADLRARGFNFETPYNQFCLLQFE